MMKQVNFRVEESDLDILEEIAVKRRMEQGVNITISDIIRCAISDFIVRENQGYKKDKEVM